MITIPDLQYAHWLSLEGKSSELSALLDKLLARLEQNKPTNSD